MNVPLPAYISSTIPGLGPDGLHHGGDQGGVGGAADLREAARRDCQRRAPGLGDVDLHAPERRLAGERQADDARLVQSVDLATGVRRAEGVGAHDVQVHPLGARLHLELDPGRQPAGERAQRRQRARQLGAEQRAARRVAEIDDVVGPARVKTERPRLAHRELGAIAVAEVGTHRAHLRELQISSARSTIAFLAARCASIVTCCHWQPPQLPKSGHRAAAPARGPGARLPSARPRPPAPSRARSARARARRARPADEGGAAVAGAGARGIALPADGVSPHGQAVDLDGDLALVAVPHVGYGEGLTCPPRARSKSKKPSSVPPITGVVGGAEPVSTAVT